MEIKVNGGLTLDDLEAHLYTKLIAAVDAGNVEMARQWLELMREASLL